MVVSGTLRSSSTIGRKEKKQVARDKINKLIIRVLSSGAQFPRARAPNTATTPLNPEKVVATPASPKRASIACSFTRVHYHSEKNHAERPRSAGLKTASSQAMKSGHAA